MRDFWDRLWYDKDGKLAIWQRPNVWLLAWAVLTAASVFINTGKTADIFGAVGSASLIIWSLLELFRGDSYFRRGLGLIVLIFSIASLLKNL